MKKLLIMALALAACNHVYFIGDGTPGETHVQSNAFFIAGLVGTARIDARAICPNGVAAIHTYETFGDGFLGAITLAIYTPRTVEITCAAGHANGPVRVLVAQDNEGRAVAAVAQTNRGETQVLKISEVAK